MESLQDVVSILLEKLQSWLETLVASLPNLAVAVVTLILFILVSKWAKKLIVRLVFGVSHNRQISELLGKLGGVAVIAVGGFIALELLALDKAVTSLLAGIGVVGIALGFAFKDMAANFVAGFVMAIQRPFMVGDLVEINEQRGRVESINLRSTELETLDGLSILVPNKNVFQNTIVNYTRTDHRRMDLAVGTAYGDDMEAVRSVVKKAVREIPYRVESKEVELFFEEFGSSSINFVVRIWLSRADEFSYLHARSEAMIAIKKALDEAGFTIPFPIRTLDFGAGAGGGERLDQMRLWMDPDRGETAP